MELLTTAELSERLGIKPYRIKYQRRHNQLPFVRWGIRVRFDWLDICDWLDVYRATKLWGNCLLFLRALGVPSERTIPKQFLEKPEWTYLHFCEIFGVPWNCKNDDRKIVMFLGIDHSLILNQVLTRREELIYRTRIKYPEIESQIFFKDAKSIPIPTAFEKITNGFNKKVTRQTIFKILKRARHKLMRSYETHFSQACSPIIARKEFA